MPTPIQEQPTGLDVSHHDGFINWSQVKAIGGASFGICKASQGVGFTDPKFASNYADMKGVGLIRGAYHYLDYISGARAQAGHYLSVVGNRQPGDLPYIVDVENWSDGGAPSYVAPHEMLLHAGAFVAEIRNQTGEYPIIYTYVYFWHDVLGNPKDFDTTCPLWIADYSHKSPRLVGGWPYHTFHQFTSTGHIPGVYPACDLDRFNGSLERLRILAGMTQ